MSSDNGCPRFRESHFKLHYQQGTIRMRPRILLVAVIAFMMAGCVSHTMIRGSDSATAVRINAFTAKALPAKYTLGDTTFGHYSFKATEPGAKPMYGTLPLDFQGGNLAMDILFFTPAMFLNLRGVYHFYMIDVKNDMVYFRNHKDAPWLSRHPTPDEVDTSRNYYQDLNN